eukprot:6188311-Pleurochrysis_carterae.AAC.2
MTRLRPSFGVPLAGTCAAATTTAPRPATSCASAPSTGLGTGLGSADGPQSSQPSSHRSSWGKQPSYSAAATASQRAGGARLCARARGSSSGSAFRQLGLLRCCRAGSHVLCADRYSACIGARLSHSQASRYVVLYSMLDAGGAGCPRQTMDARLLDAVVTVRGCSDYCTSY